MQQQRTELSSQIYRHSPITIIATPFDDIDPNLGTAMYQIIRNDMCATITENFKTDYKSVYNHVNCPWSVQLIWQPRKLTPCLFFRTKSYGDEFSRLSVSDRDSTIQFLVNTVTKISETSRTDKRTSKNLNWDFKRMTTRLRMMSLNRVTSVIGLSFISHCIKLFDIALKTHPAGTSDDWQFGYVYHLIDHMY